MAKDKKAITRLGDWQATFLATLADCGNVSGSIKAAGVGMSTAYRHRRTDPKFARSWRRSLRMAADALEAEARRRAVDGVKRPVYQGGKKVGEVREYSDTLLIFLLKAARPIKFRENIKVLQPRGPVGGIDPRNLTDEELETLERIVVNVNRRAGIPTAVAPTAPVKPPLDYEALEAELRQVSIEATEIRRRSGLTNGN